MHTSKLQLSVIRRNLLVEQNERCFYCSHVVNLEIHIGQQPQDAATLDHLLPITYGGDDMPVNFVIACHLCNNLRLHFRNPQTFKEIIIEILKNETVCDKWHTFTQKELYVVRQIIYRELAKRDSEWAFEIVKDNHLKPL